MVTIANNPTATSWTTPQNSTAMAGINGQPFWVPNYMLDFNSDPRFAGFASQRALTKYYAMMLGKDYGDIQDALPRILAGGDQARTAFLSLQDKYGVLPYANQIINSWDLGMTLMLINAYGYGGESAWPTSFGAFTFTSLAPGEPQNQASLDEQGLPLAPPDSPVPPRPAPASSGPATGPNEYGDYVGIQTGPSTWSSLPGDTTASGAKVTDARGVFECTVFTPPFGAPGSGRYYTKVS